MPVKHQIIVLVVGLCLVIRPTSAQSVERSMMSVSGPADSLDQRAAHWRPAYHFTPSRNWINDPNGLIYHRGEYHLFYQYNPKGQVSGYKVWGHAISPDLLQWQQLPVAIPAPNDTTHIFSGGVVADEQNTSGLCPTGDCLVAIYTVNQPRRQSQHLAYSHDRGRTWQPYKQNPVLDVGKRDFRDPFIWWYPPARQWRMAVVLPLNYTVQFYGSTNLKEWQLLSEFGRQGDMRAMWECPALIELPVDGEPGSSRWVLFVSASHPAGEGYVGMQYFTGTFDGTTFRNDNPSTQTLVCDWGKDFYAAIPWLNAPGNRTLWLGWMSNWKYAKQLPTSPYRGQMSLPRDLSLRRYADGLRLVQRPVKELARYRRTLLNAIHPDVATLNRLLAQPSDRLLEIELTFQPQAKQPVVLELARNRMGQQTILRYDPDRQELHLDRRQSGDIPVPAFATVETAPLPPDEGKISLHILLDRSSVEVFANNGRVVMTELIFPKLGPHHANLVIDPKTTIESCRIYSVDIP